MSTELESAEALREFEVFKERLIEAIGTGEIYGWASSHGFNKGTLYNIMSRQRIPGIDILKREVAPHVRTAF